MRPPDPDLSVLRDYPHAGYKLHFAVAANVATYDRAAGSLGSALDDANRYTLQRRTIEEWDDLFMKELEEMTGVPRRVDQKETDRRASGKPVLERFKLYNAYVWATWVGTDKERKDKVLRLAQAVADTLWVDPAPVEKQVSVPKHFYDKADSLLSADVNARESRITTYLDTVSFDLERKDGVPTRDSLARLLRQYSDAIL